MRKSEGRERDCKRGGEHLSLLSFLLLLFNFQKFLKIKKISIHFVYKKCFLDESMSLNVHIMFLIHEYPRKYNNHHFNHLKS